MKKIHLRTSYFFLLFLVCSISLDSSHCFAEETYKLIIKDHKFFPQEINIPANQKVKLIIENQDMEAEEFESFDLRREKIIPANSQIKINIGPLSKGKYKFYGEFHIETALGIIIVN